MMKKGSAVMFLILLLISPVSGLIFHGVATPPGGSDIWVVTIETTAVFYSSNFGLGWNSVEIPTIRDFFDVFFLTTDSGWTCGRTGDIWRTTDGGNNWERKNLGGPKHAARIRFIDTEFGWAAGGDIVQLKTTDGGETWVQIFLPIPPFPRGDTAEFQGVYFVNRSTGFLVAGHWPIGDTFLGGQGLIAKTTDGGNSWVILRRDTTYDFYDVFFVDENNGWVVGGDDRNFRAVVLRTTDGGSNWREQNLPPEARFLRAVKFVSYRKGWACGRNGTIIYTSDGGNNWTLQNSPAESTLFDIDFADSLRGVAAGNGVVIVTTDGGENWSVSISGINEGATSIKMLNVFFTLYSKTIKLPEDFDGGYLFDVSGRKLSSLYPGLNNLNGYSRLRSGIYFLFSEEAQRPTYKLIVR